METTEAPPKKRNIIPKEVWEAVRAGCYDGIAAEVLSVKYAINAETIRKRAEKEGWYLPRKIAQETLRQTETVPTLNVSEKIVAAPPRRRDWVEAAVEYRNMIMDKIEAGVQGMNLEPPKTWRDAEIADRMARKAVGLESGETTVIQTIIPIGKGDFGVERDVSPEVQR